VGRRAQVLMDWGRWRNLTGIPDDDINLNEYTGFVYRITFDEGAVYYGKKTLWYRRRRPPLKGKKRIRIDHIESDWRRYSSSSNEVGRRIAERPDSAIHFDIIGLFSSKSTLSLGENVAIALARIFARDNLIINFLSERTGGGFAATERDQQQLERIVHTIVGGKDFEEAI
jgi:hypothetical protein